jgi:hypothetical protein
VKMCKTCHAQILAVKLDNVDPEYTLVQLARNTERRGWVVGHLDDSGMQWISQYTWKTSKPVP